jgi:chaperonin GroES
MTRIVPLHNNLIVEPFQLGEISKGGLLIPQVAKASTPYRYAKVLEVGPGRVNAEGKVIPINISVGDVVAYAKNSGVEMPLDDADGNELVVLLINEQYVLGIIKDMPEQSAITGIDGRLLTMAPGSRARSDGAYQALDNIARARKDGFIDTQGGTLDAMEAMDTAEAEAD